MSIWQVVMLSDVLGSLLGYVALASIILRHRNGPMWTALQLTVIGDVIRSAAWGWRIWRYPNSYRTPDLDMFVILIGQSMAAIAVWVLAVHMRKAVKKR